MQSRACGGVAGGTYLFALPGSPGGCRDALHVDRVNQNQGAESTLAFLLSLAEMQLTQNDATVLIPPVT